MPRRFKFRLAAVLRVRRMDLEARQRAVAQRQRRILDLQAQAMRIDRQISAQTDMARQALQTESLPLQQVLWDRQQIGRLRRELMETIANGQQEQARLLEEQQALKESLQKVRVLEKYEERLRAAHQAAEARLERINEDEMNALRFAIEATS